ncbi:hypothetical protein SAMN05443634_105196 [Chishuiella changwenlii]|uniref:Uncharacterized protein n=1 Tax=Chishuiella changwenlii TaxID=1434701 RepID=A0A1M6XCR1_9FLAO|nr:hypothetical protein [Chishuiella changwenlii]GGF00421.1 hypothetical protein GCM10010984_17490 [Chishuiella changwenlii]SHL03585.1 hypothetical protein SAMN05443634_105196 [Chishuiella changwenlii]
MSLVQQYLEDKPYLIRSDFPKVFGIDYRTFENYYVMAPKNDDRRISKMKIEIIKIPKNKMVKKLFKTNQVIEFLALHGVYPRKEFKTKKASVSAEA